MVLCSLFVVGCAWCEMGFDPSRQGMWGPWPSPRGAKKRIQEGDADWENRIETPQALVGVCPQKLTKKCPSWMLKDVIDVQGPGFTEWKKNQPEARRIAHRLLTNNLGATFAVLLLFPFISSFSR